MQYFDNRIRSGAMKRFVQPRCRGRDANAMSKVV